MTLVGDSPRSLLDMTINVPSLAVVLMTMGPMFWYMGNLSSRVDSMALSAAKAEALVTTMQVANTRIDNLADSNRDQRGLNQTILMRLNDLGLGMARVQAKLGVDSTGAGPR